MEEKGIAVAVHTRRLPDQAGALARLTPVLTEAAAAHDLVLEPGRHVLEVRAAGMDKGMAVRALAEKVEARGFLFAGDDLGDLEAFAAVAGLRARGLATLLVCSGSEEETTLADRADLVVDGPDGVMALLGRLADDMRSARRPTRW
ncbi:MAG: trehalose-phosphatase [Nocardioides sp.]